MQVRAAVEPVRDDAATSPTAHPSPDHATPEHPAPAHAAPEHAAPEHAAIIALIEHGQHREALAACARAYGTVLGRLCMALLGSQADAEEATQESLLRAHRGMASYRGDGSVKAWLCGIARHVCAHTLETRRRGREALELAPVEPEACDAFARRQRARAIRQALACLKPSEREALVLRYVADLSHREIAAAIHLDEAAARKRISRALAHLRTVMPDQEIDS
jgi:RNA polymerase sigma-70 factor (ECF subfamily)